MSMDFVEAMLAENPRYRVQETVDATNISRKTVYNRLAKIWDTSIEFRGYWRRPTLRTASPRSISFSTDAKEILFSKGLVTWRLEFRIKMCVENALDSRTMDLRLSWSMDFTRTNFFYPFNGIGKVFSLLWAPLSTWKPSILEDIAILINWK